VCPLSLANEFMLCRGLKKNMHFSFFFFAQELYGRSNKILKPLVCLIKSSDSPASILKLSINSELYKL
jgi:hypothetical protein